MKTLKELMETNPTKEELFKNLKLNFDYSLPQDWLDNFSNWCKKYNPEITYPLIRSTTVFAESDKGYLWNPVFGCVEVMWAYFEYLKNP